jgi:fructose 1,6-bisphosphate aldolase/phosphatase
VAVTKVLDVDATISVFTGCAGGYVGAGGVHPALIEAARESVSHAKEAGRISDGFVTRCGDDIGLVCLHPGPRETLDTFAFDTFTQARAVAVRLAQHGSDNGGVRLDRAELTLTRRGSEPVLVFLSDKCGPGAWNVYLYRMFADPFNTPSLVSDPLVSEGFRFVLGAGESFVLPEDLHDFLRAAGTDGRCVTRVESRATGATVAVASDGPDPVLIVRCEAPFPGVGEVLEALAFPFVVAANRSAPLMPVSTNDESCTRSDGPPRAIGLGFQIGGDRLIGPRDMLGDPSFDDARRKARAAADYLGRHGPFAPAVSAVTAPV